MVTSSRRCEEARPTHVGHACSTTGSCGSKGDTDKIRSGFTVFKTIRYDPKGKSLNFCLGLIRGASIGEHPRQVNDFCEPTTVFLLFNFHAKVHLMNFTPFPSALKGS